MADDDGGLDIMDGTDVLPDAMLNKVNKGLKAQILLYEQEVENKAKDISDNKTRLNLMSEHLVNVRTEIKNTQELCEAKKRVFVPSVAAEFNLTQEGQFKTSLLFVQEIETEDHMAQLAERTIGRVKAEMKTIAQQKTEIQDKLDNIQNSIFQGNMKMDDFKAHMNFNQEELEQWDLARSAAIFAFFGLFVEFHKVYNRSWSRLSCFSFFPNGLAINCSTQPTRKPEVFPSLGNKRRTTRLLYKSIIGRTMRKSRSSICRSKNCHVQYVLSQYTNTSIDVALVRIAVTIVDRSWTKRKIWNARLLRHKPHKLSWTKQPRTSRICTKNARYSRQQGSRHAFIRVVQPRSLCIVQPSKPSHSSMRL